jgi:hypothetical protein
VSEPSNQSNNRHRRRRPRNYGRPQGNQQGPNPNQGQGQNQNQSSGSQSSGNRNRRSGGRPLSANQVLVKYDNLLEQHLITRRKYYEYFNRVDDRQLKRLEKNFFASIEHLRRFEESLEPWQRDVLEKRKTERYRPDFTYSNNRNLDGNMLAPIEVSPDEIEDPHFKESQKEAFAEYKADTEESEGTFEDYLKLKGLA